MWETWVGKFPWRRAWQPTPVFLPGESLCTEEPGGLQSIGLQRVQHDWATKYSTAQEVSRFSSGLLLWCFQVKLKLLVTQAPLSLEFSRQEYWTDCHFLLQGIFPTQGWNLYLLHYRQTFYQLSWFRKDQFPKGCQSNTIMPKE